MFLLGERRREREKKRETEKECRQLQVERERPPKRGSPLHSHIFSFSLFDPKEKGGL